MIIDLLEALGGSLRESSGLSAQFDTASQAVSAAKHIQRAVQGFSSPTASLGTAILVSDADPDAVSDQEVRHVLEQAQPGQIFVTPQIRKALPDNAAWKFRPLSMGSSNGSPMSEELVWADPEMYERFAELLHSGKTWIISDPVSEQAPAPEPVLTESTTYDPTQIPIATESSAPDGLFEGLEESTTSKTPYLIAATVILSAMLGGYALLRYSQRQQMTAGAMAARQEPTKAPSSASPNTQKSPSELLKPVGATAERTASTEKKSPPVPQSAPAEPSPVQKAEVAPVRPPAVQRPTEEVGIYRMTPAEKSEAAKAAVDISPKQINQLLAMADEQTGDGRFAEARTKYLIVLYLEPRNAAANKGMIRLLKRQREADQ